MATKRYSGLLGAPFKICVRHTCHFYGGVPNQQGAKHPLFLILASKNWGFGLTPHFQRGYEAHEIPPCLPRDLLRDSFAENLRKIVKPTQLLSVLRWVVGGRVGGFQECGVK